jgi:ketosteroid isomerase-like protein
MAIIKHTHIRQLMLPCLIILLLVTTGCKQQAAPRPPLSADDVKTLSTEFERIANANADAWDKGDLEPMYQVYAPDIKYYDSSPYEHFVQGADILIPFMTDHPIKNLPNMEVRLADTYIGRGIGVDVWDIRGTFDIPVSGYDLYTIREGKIAEWWGYMSSAAAAADGQPFSENLLQNYAAAWSSGDPDAVANLYTPDVERQDTLFGYDQHGSTTVKDFAADFFAWYPGVRLELQDSLQWSAKDLGGVYAIHVTDQEGKPCDVRAIILSESSKDKIINERLFYNADSLIACGWAQ